MQPSPEISIDLTDQEMLEPPVPSATVEVDDIGDIDSLLQTGSLVADSPRPNPATTTNDAIDATVEIELSGDQMAILLGDPVIR